MAGLRPVSRDELVSRLRKLGFDGPLPGGSHQYMVRNSRKVRLPNPHGGDIPVGLLRQILNVAGVSREQWLGQDRLR